MSTSSVTKLFLFNTDNQPLVAEVLSANPTATAFLLNCPSGTDGNNCGTYNESVTIGAWAKPTPPPDSTKGVYDINIDMEDEWHFSIHCDMSATVPAACTTINIGGNDDGSPTATFTSPASDDDNGLGWGYMPVTITSGLEKLASVSADPTATAGSSNSSGMPSGSSASATDTGMGTGMPASTGTGSSSASGSGGSGAMSASAAAETGSGAGSLMASNCVGNFAIIGMVLGWLLR